MSDKTFLGAGMKFPPQINPGTGRFAVSEREKSVKESVYLILMTNRGERWLAPDFGSTMLNYTFMDTSVTMLKLMSDNLRDMILSQEPRISDVQINIDSQSHDGCLIIAIDYVVAATNAHENLVFPFYLNAAREEIAYEP